MLSWPYLFSAREKTQDINLRLLFVNASLDPKSSPATEIKRQKIESIDTVSLLPAVLEEIVVEYAKPDEFDRLTNYDPSVVLTTAARCGRVDCLRKLCHDVSGLIKSDSIKKQLLLIAIEKGHVSILQESRAHWGMRPPDAVNILKESSHTR